MPDVASFAPWMQEKTRMRLLSMRIALMDLRNEPWTG
jgi:hypothetical protein